MARVRAPASRSRSARLFSRPPPPPGNAGRRPAPADDAVARADDGDRVASVGAADGARLARVSDAGRDLAVAGRLAAGDGQAGGPHAALEGGAALGTQVEVEAGPVACEVLAQLGDGRLEAG